jgi:hypothetical protein
MLNYEDFYDRIWNYFISESDVSFDYREKNQDFLRTVTFSMYREYEKHNINELVYAKLLKTFFSNLFLFKADNFDSGEIRDFNRE